MLATPGNISPYPSQVRRVADAGSVQGMRKAANDATSETVSTTGGGRGAEEMAPLWLAAKDSRRENAIPEDARRGRTNFGGPTTVGIQAPRAANASGDEDGGENTERGEGSNDERRPRI